MENCIRLPQALRIRWRLFFSKFLCFDGPCMRIQLLFVHFIPYTVYSLVVFSSEIFGSPSIYLVGICLDLGLQFSLQLQRNWRCIKSRKPGVSEAIALRGPLSHCYSFYDFFWRLGGPSCDGINEGFRKRHGRQAFQTSNHLEARLATRTVGHWNMGVCTACWTKKELEVL